MSLVAKADRTTGRRLITLHACALLLGLTGTAAADPVADFLAADANGDRLLESSEFRAFVNRRAQGGDATAQRVRSFRAYSVALSRVDGNGDGRVSGDELRTYDANR